MRATAGGWRRWAGLIGYNKNDNDRAEGSGMQGRFDETVSLAQG